MDFVYLEKQVWLEIWLELGMVAQTYTYSLLPIDTQMEWRKFFLDSVQKEVCHLVQGTSGSPRFSSTAACHICKV